MVLSGIVALVDHRSNRVLFKSVVSAYTHHLVVELVKRFARPSP